MEKKKIWETIGDIVVTVVAIGIGTMIASVTVIFLYSMFMALFD
jgi:hypothetical protein